MRGAAVCCSFWLNSDLESTIVASGERWIIIKTGNVIECTLHGCAAAENETLLLPDTIANIYRPMIDHIFACVQVRDGNNYFQGIAHPSQNGAMSVWVQTENSERAIYKNEIVYGIIMWFI